MLNSLSLSSVFSAAESHAPVVESLIKDKADGLVPRVEEDRILVLEVKLKVLFVLNVQALNDANYLSFAKASLPDIEHPLSALHLNGKLLGHNLLLLHVLEALKLRCGLEADGPLLKWSRTSWPHDCVSASRALLFFLVVIARGALLQLVALVFFFVVRVGD